MTIKIAQFKIESYDQAFRLWQQCEGIAFWKTMGWDQRADISVISKNIRHFANDDIV